MERKLTCIVCPLGCEITVTLENGKIQNITGNTCPRGRQYAENECTAPKRTVTSTVRCKGGGLVSVKTETPVPKEKMAECMEIINKAEATPPVNIGDVIIEDLFGSRVVATSNKK